MREITYSQKPITLRNSISGYKFATGDPTGVLELILDRTDLTEEEALNLTMTELTEVSNKLADSLQFGRLFDDISKGFE